MCKHPCVLFSLLHQNKAVAWCALLAVLMNDVLTNSLLPWMNEHRATVLLSWVPSSFTFVSPLFCQKNFNYIIFYNYSSIKMNKFHFSSHFKRNSKFSWASKRFMGRRPWTNPANGEVSTEGMFPCPEKFLKRTLWPQKKCINAISHILYQPCFLVFFSKEMGGVSLLLSFHIF